MSPDVKFKVQQIDHVEVFVPDRGAAAKWYSEVFGLEILGDFGDWAKAPGGPLMLSSDGGSKLALSRAAIGHRWPPPGLHFE